MRLALCDSSRWTPAASYGCLIASATIQSILVALHLTIQQVDLSLKIDITLAF